LDGAGRFDHLFNLMARLVDGLGGSAGPDYLSLSARRLADSGYAALKPLLRKSR